MAMSGRVSNSDAARINPLITHAANVEALKHLLSIEKTSEEPRMISLEYNFIIEHQNNNLKAKHFSALQILYFNQLSRRKL